MSATLLSLSAGAAMPDVQTLTGTISELMYLAVGVAMLGTVAILFKPLLAGIVQAAVVFFVPRRSLEQRVRDHRFNGIRILNRMANDFSRSQPNFAAELRVLATRDN